MDDDATMTAIRAVVEMRGGMAAAEDGNVLAPMPLPVAGLMNDQPIETVRDQMDELLRTSRERGSPLHDPFMATSFLALSLIPALKIAGKGLVDVSDSRIVPLFAD